MTPWRRPSQMPMKKERMKARTKRLLNWTPLTLLPQHSKSDKTMMRSVIYISVAVALLSTSAPGQPASHEHWCRHHHPHDCEAEPGLRELRRIARGRATSRKCDLTLAANKRGA